MKGDLVVLRSADGPLLGRVLDATEGLVYIASPEQYQRRAEGLAALDPVVFPREHVFIYDPNAEVMLARGDFAWTDAVPY